MLQKLARLAPGHRNLLVMAIAMAAIVAGALWRHSDPLFLAAVRNLSFDTYQRIHPRQALGQPITIIDIDERSIAEYGQWPWPRTKIAEMVDRLTEMNAAVIAFDMVFSEPDRTGARRFVEDLRNYDAPVADAAALLLKDLPDNDGILAQAFARSQVVAGFFNDNRSRMGLPLIKAGTAVLGDSNLADILPSITSSVKNLPEIEAAAAGNGSLTLSAQTDEVVRSVPMFLSDGTKTYPTLSIEAIRLALGASSYTLKTTSASTETETYGTEMVSFRVGQLSVPVTRDGQFVIYYSKFDPQIVVSAADILADDPAPFIDKIEGHMIFIGTSASGLRDIRATALGEAVPGVYMHAQVADQILSSSFLTRPDWSEGVEIGLMVLLCFLIVLILPLAGAMISALFGAVVAGGILLGSWVAFTQSGMLFDPVFPLVSSLLVYLGATTLQFAFAEREKRFVRGAFQRYLAPDLLKKLEDNPDALKLGGEIRDMTLMFMDVRGFTPISEKLSPEELVTFLNRLLSPLSDVIQDHEGAIDKYIGDSIMAFWNAPLDVEDHPVKAARAALQMVTIVEQLNASDHFGFHQPQFGLGDVAIGVGINSGMSCVGNMGSSSRFNYSVVGDTVNIAARIESSCKEIGWPVLLSEMTANQCKGFAMLEARAIALKGKSRPVKLFALIGDEKLGATPQWQELAARHETCMHALAAGNRRKAAEIAAQCRKMAPANLDEFYLKLIGEIKVKAVAAVH
ncbi:MAG: adenylate/guanylate cyclase domain-containing protein [Rhizobiaceae bacterium]